MDKKAMAARRWQALKAYDCITYEIRERGEPTAIHCFCCGLTSFNPNDIAHLYCGCCKEYHMVDRDRVPGQLLSEVLAF